MAIFAGTTDSGGSGMPGLPKMGRTVSAGQHVVVDQGGKHPGALSRV
jgi:hypothetical protein